MWEEEEAHQFCLPAPFLMHYARISSALHNQHLMADCHTAKDYSSTFPSTLLHKGLSSLCFVQFSISRLFWNCPSPWNNVGNWKKSAASQSSYSYFEGINAWIQLPEMHCPRAQPAVVGHQGLLYVMGGRNSKKVELKSVECYDPVTNSWILLEDGLRKKRWSAAAVPFGQDNLMLIGGRGKWVQGNSVEIFCSDQWRLAAGPGPRAGHDKRYTATLVTRPSDRWGNGPSSS